MRVLFVSRKHPPSVGGMQRLSYHLINEMRDRVKVKAITWGGSQKFLPLFLPYALIRSIYISQRGIDLIHLGDPVLSPIGWIMKKVLHVPAIVSVHGLDLTFPTWMYQQSIPRLLKELDCIVCISNHTRTICIEKGIPAQKCQVIQPGVQIPSKVPRREAAHKWLEKTLGQKLKNTLVLLTVGRLVPRKGVAWFVELVLPSILAARSDVCYLVVGNGPDHKNIQALVTQMGLENKVHILGQISEASLFQTYAASDLFVMPNLAIPGDVEGFGLVALEAAAHAVPVLAADLEGIRDAVVPEITGRLVESANAAVWIANVLEFLRSPAALRRMGHQARITAKERFTWKHMADAYETLFHEIVGK